MSGTPGYAKIRARRVYEEENTAEQLVIAKIKFYPSFLFTQIQTVQLLKQLKLLL